jgi:hypothetical protein
MEYDEYDYDYDRWLVLLVATYHIPGQSTFDNRFLAFFTAAESSVNFCTWTHTVHWDNGVVIRTRRRPARRASYVVARSHVDVDVDVHPTVPEIED